MRLPSSTVDFILATLNATEVGSLDSIKDKLLQVRGALSDAGQSELATRVDKGVQALDSGDLTEFKRLRAFLQAKVGHLRQ